MSTIVCLVPNANEQDLRYTTSFHALLLPPTLLLSHSFTLAIVYAYLGVVGTAEYALFVVDRCLFCGGCSCEEEDRVFKKCDSSSRPPSEHSHLKNPVLVRWALSSVRIWGHRTSASFLKRRTLR